MLFTYDRMHIKPEDYLEITDDNKFTGYIYHMPSGPMQENEISTAIYKDGTKAKYHMHNRGYETFTLETGTAEVTIGGKRCNIEAGDMVQIEPHMPHGFIFQGEGSRWREMFQELGQFNNHLGRRYAAAGNIALLDDDEFMKEFRAHIGNIQLPEPEPVLVDKSEMPMITPKGKGHVAFTAEGIAMVLKIGRWQLNGNKEIWEYTIDKDWAVLFGHKNPYESIYVVNEGLLRVEAAGRKFTAKPGDMVCIPPYTPFKLIAQEEKTVLMDYNCKMTLFRMLEEIETDSAKEGANPEEVRAKYFASNKCHAISFKKIP